MLFKKFGWSKPPPNPTYHSFFGNSFTIVVLYTVGILKFQSISLDCIEFCEITSVSIPNPRSPDGLFPSNQLLFLENHIVSLKCLLLCKMQSIL